MKTLYALLVGIEDYPPPVPPLNGCINDLKKMEAYLSGLTGVDLKLRVLKNEEATRDNIFKGFREHLMQAGAGDTILFYFSGHGTQEEADPDLWPFEPDRKLEALVGYDGVTEGPNGKEYRLIADKELRFLIHKLAQTKAHVLTIFDCCHSGGNTRNSYVSGEIRDARERRYRIRDTLSNASPVRPWEDFVFSGEVDPGALRNQPIDNALPEGQHVQLAACAGNQSAFELNGEGIFTKNLIEVLERCDSEITYYDLKSRIRNFIKNQFDQTPQIYAQGGETSALFQGFLGRKVEGKPLYGNVVYNRNEGWLMDLGAMHGISPQAKHVQIVSRDGTEKYDAVIDLVEADTTYLRIQGQLQADRQYRAYLDEFLSAPVKVFLDSDEGGAAGKTLLEAAFDEAGPNVNLAMTESEADYVVRIGDSRYQITRPGDPDRPLVQSVAHFSGESAGRMMTYLHHIAKYEFVKNLHNPNTFLFSDHPVLVQIFRVLPGGVMEELDVSNDEVLIEYLQKNNGEWGGSIRIKLTNQFDSRLYCSLLLLTINFQVYPKMLSALTVGLEPGESVWAFDGRNIDLGCPEQVLAYNWPDSVDYLKLIVNTRDFDVTLLEQGPLPAPTESTRGERNILPPPDDYPPASDWTTRLLTMRYPNPEYRGGA